AGTQAHQIDLSIAQENIWLETSELGLGGVWLGIAPLQDRMDAVRKVMNLPENIEAFSIFALGYPAEKRVQRDRFDGTRIHYVK
ncbi:MAG: nitroreductase family protein, partial [Clostridia bacterium]|nr:nitroreductase family protein [Clostridia bacterium]